MKKDLTKLNKKELKDYINKDGFYFHMNCNSVAREDLKDNLKTDKVIKTNVSIPEDDGIIIYEGLISQNYKKGEKSLNGYKYDQTGWNFDRFNQNPLVFFQHDSERVCGNVTKFWWDEAGNLRNQFFIYKNALDETDKFRVEKGLIKALSTGALSDEYKFEDVENWKLLSEEEAEEKYSYIELLNAFMGDSESLILTITKATMVENSLVTLGSNAEAIAIKNGIGKFAGIKAEELKAKYAKNEEEEKKEELKETEDNPVEDKKDEKAETDGDKEEPTTETDTKDDDKEKTKTEDENKESKDSLKELDWKISEITNNFAKLEKDFVSNEIFATVNDNLKSLKDNFENSKKDLEDKVKSLEELNEALFETVETLTNKLQNTVFDSARQYKEEAKPVVQSALAQQLELAKQNL